MANKPSSEVKLLRKTLRAARAGNFDASDMRGGFTVYVTNKSNWNIICWGLAANGPWHRLSPPIRKTCNSTCKECWTKGNYAPVHTFPNDTDFDIYLVAERGGRYLYLDPARITPTPGASGMAVCVDLKD